MNLEEIMENMDTTSDYETLIEKLRIQLACRKNHKLFAMISDVIGVTEISMSRWLTGKRAVTKQSLRSLQMLDLLLRISKNYTHIPLKKIPAVNNKSKSNLATTSESPKAASIQDLLKELDLD